MLLSSTPSLGPDPALDDRREQVDYLDKADRMRRCRYKYLYLDQILHISTARVCRISLQNSQFFPETEVKRTELRRGRRSTLYSRQRIIMVAKLFQKFSFIHRQWRIERFQVKSTLVKWFSFIWIWSFTYYLQGEPKKRTFSKHNRFSWITQPRMHQF